MPEGDTIFRSAASLRKWIGGRVITGARSQRQRVPPGALVGHRVEAVEAAGKHLLIRLSSGQTLHTHMQMTGAWHVYRQGERWRKPSHLARVVLEAGDRVAVCFDAPVVELLDAEAERTHPSLSRLGPDVLVEPLDLDEVVRRAREVPPTTTVGELLLDQRVVAGIGNIYRCEALFRRRVDPLATVAQVSDEVLSGVVAEASKLMRANVSQGFERETGAGRGRRWVYGRRGKPCLRCGTAVRSKPHGTEARTGPRTLYWCPKCQASSQGSD